MYQQAWILFSTAQSSMPNVNGLISYIKVAKPVPTLYSVIHSYMFTQHGHSAFKPVPTLYSVIHSYMFTQHGHSAFKPVLTLSSVIHSYMFTQHGLCAFKPVPTLYSVIHSYMFTQHGYIAFKQHNADEHLPSFYSLFCSWIIVVYIILLKLSVFLSTVS